METKWWQKEIVYEIYCKSFCDSNGDGIGDLQGVLSKLPMLKELGVGCIWFAPLYQSPQVDNGYDVADYQDIYPAYGTMEDFKQVLDEAHKLGIRVIMDMVLNHSSDEHRWFQESRKSRDNPYRNYYIWKEPKADGSEPNNWGSYFREGNGSIWEKDALTGDYYLHQYAIKMPDLNWEYQPLREEIYKMLNWWLDMGIDGFRLDVISRLKKMPGFPDSTKEPDPKMDRNGFVVDKTMCTDVEGIHDFLRELNERVFSKCPCVTVGEGAGVTWKNGLNYVGKHRKELDIVYHFELSSRTRQGISPEQFRTVQKNWAEVTEQGGWAVQYLSNHDSQRQVSAYGQDGKYRTRSAKFLCTLNMTTPGTPFVYQGDEIGMVNVEFDDIEKYNCRYTWAEYTALVHNGMVPEEALKFVAPRSRDNARTPYQWNGEENAGFTTGKPWLGVNPRYKEINLEKDRASEDSVFAYYQKAIALRRTSPALTEGALKFYLEDHPQILAYTRTCPEETLLIVANYSGKPAEFTLPEELMGKKFTPILSNMDTPLAPETDKTLAPWEVCVYSL